MVSTCINTFSNIINTFHYSSLMVYIRHTHTHKEIVHAAIMTVATSLLQISSENCVINDLIMTDLVNTSCLVTQA